MLVALLGGRGDGLAWLVFRDWKAQPQPIAHHFHRPLFGRVPMQLGMAGIETLSYGEERRRGDLPLKQAGKRYAQLIALAAVAQVELAREAARARVHALDLELVARLSFQLLENLLGMRGTY